MTTTALSVSYTNLAIMTSKECSTTKSTKTLQWKDALITHIAVMWKKVKDTNDKVCSTINLN
uniref:Uncharacterized protein n=1 Tax=Rhizophora mucronata TaxID=61149 RepID=A0A2P2PTA8_RHIMU